MGLVCIGELSYFLASHRWSFNFIHNAFSLCGWKTFISNNYIMLKCYMSIIQVH